MAGSWSRYWMALRYAAQFKKPRLMWRLFKNALAVYVLRRPLLRYVDSALDFACNLSCEHCFAKGLERPGERRLTVDDYRTISRECRELGAVAFSFQGGEPFLFFDRLVEVVEAFDPASALISVTTNGTLCTPETIARLAVVGVDTLTISVDSGDADEHDAFRGERGAFARTMASIDLALAAGLNVTIGTTLSHANVRSDGVRAIMDFASRRRCLLVFALAVPAGRWQTNDGILLDQDDLVLINEYCSSNMYVKTDLEGNYLHRGCGAAKEILYLTPYGHVLSCPFLHVSFGRVPDEPIRIIRERALTVPWLSSYWPCCLAAASPPFRDTVLRQIRDHEGPLPVDWRDIDWGQPF